jgi:hypothetical protein
MSVRSSITNALVEKLKTIDGTSYTSNISNTTYALTKFWDEVFDFPSVYITPGPESREYLPGGFKWSYLNLSIKVYTKGEDPINELEVLLGDIETVIDLNRVLTYDTNKETTDIYINSIVTDEGLLLPYAVGEVSITVRYQVL